MTPKERLESLRRKKRLAELRAKAGKSKPEPEPQRDTPVTKPDVSQLESGVRGAAQGVSLGWADELAAGGKAIYDDIKSIFTGDNPNKGGATPEYDERGEVSNPKELVGNYDEHLSDERGKYDAARVANPKTFMAGEFAGSMAVPGPTGVLKAAAMGTADALGQSEAQSAGGLVKDAAVGGVLGGTFGGMTKAIGKRGQLAKRVGKSADHAAEDAAGLTRTLGDRRKLLKELDNQKLSDGELGRYLRDNKLVTKSDRIEDIAHKIGAKREEVGKAIEEMVAEGKPVSVTSLAERLKSKVGDYSESGVSEETKRRLGSVAKNYKKIAQPEVQEVSKILDSRGSPIVTGMKEGKDTVPLSQIRRDRTSVGRKVGDFASTSPTKQADKDIYKTLSDSLRQSVKDPKKWDKLNREYNLIKHVDDNAIANAAAAQGKQGLRVGNIVPATLGMKAGGLLGATGAVMANNAAAQRGAQMRLGALEKLEGLLKTPEVVPEPIRNLLMDAAKRGQLAATHAILSKEVPEYDQWLAEAEEN